MNNLALVSAAPSGNTKSMDVRGRCGERYVQEGLLPEVASRQVQVTPSPMLLEHLL